MLLQLPYFPIDQPLPEERQIGRRPVIDGLERRLAAVSHQWVIGERRIGKTSVARAALKRLRRQGSMALSVDLSKFGIVTDEGLAGEIARQVRTAQAFDQNQSGQRLLNLARRHRGSAQQIGTLLGELGLEGEGRTLKAVAALLAGDEQASPRLGDALAAVAVHARATGHHAFVLLDEVQLIDEAPGADRHLARWCREDDSPIVFVFAGSEKTAVEALRQDGRPLCAIGHEFPLPDIGREDWLAGLRARFAEAAIPIERQELEALVIASAGHPRRTMLIASNVQGLWEARPDGASMTTIVELAINDAERDRAWS